MSDSKKNILFLLLIGVAVLATMATIMTSKSVKHPDNEFIHKQHVIHNTGSFSQLYADEIFEDYGKQSFGIEIVSRGNDIHVYTLANSTSKIQQIQFSNWLVNFYGAIEMNIVEGDEHGK